MRSHLSYTNLQSRRRLSHCTVLTPLADPLNVSLGMECEAMFYSQGMRALSTVHDSWAFLAWGYDTCDIPITAVCGFGIVPQLNNSPGLG